MDEDDEERAEGEVPEEDEAIPPALAIGSTASWTSETRDEVSGTSTVIGRNGTDKTGLDCILVSDVIIACGEETTANKRMCRGPGSRRYALVA